MLIRECRLLRIGITGVPGTGKTALAAQIAKKLQLPLIKDQARQVAEVLGVNLKTLRSGNQETLEFQKAVLMSQLAAEEMYGTFVTDTTTIDYLAYWRLLGGENDGKNEIYRKWCLEKANYSLLVYLPSACSDESSARLEKEIMLTLEEAKKPFIMACGSLEDRLNFVLSAITRSKGGEQRCGSV